MLPTYFTYTKDLQHVAVGIVTGEFVACAIEAEHELLRIRREADMGRVRLRHGVLSRRWEGEGLSSNVKGDLKVYTNRKSRMHDAKQPNRIREGGRGPA